MYKMENHCYIGTQSKSNNVKSTQLYVENCFKAEAELGGQNRVASDAVAVTESILQWYYKDIYQNLCKTGKIIYRSTIIKPHWTFRKNTIGTVDGKKHLKYQPGKRDCVMMLPIRRGLCFDPLRGSIKTETRNSWRWKLRTTSYTRMLVVWLWCPGTKLDKLVTMSLNNDQRIFFTG